MLKLIFGKTLVKRAQKHIDRLNPKIDVRLPLDLPFSSIGIVKEMATVVSKVNAFESQIKAKTDDELRARTKEFKEHIRQAMLESENNFKRINQAYQEEKDAKTRGDLLNEIDKAKKDLRAERQKVLDEILPEAFAIVREASIRTTGMRHFDIQLLGGIILHKGNIAEMATGEGKTLVATLPVYLNALTGKGVHVVTVNDYLANRDREWMGPIYEFLGLTVGVIQHEKTPKERQYSYGCDITYGTNNEFGFDYLRDNMVSFKEEMVQREHYFAVVDEVDSILIDEARTPLIISGPAEESTDKYYTANTIAKQLKGRRITEKEEIDAKYKGENISAGFDYVADEKARSISMTEDGEKKAAQIFGVANLHDMETIEYRHHILQALKAKEFFKRDVDYVVRDGEVIIVDEFTGRMMPGRRWSDGLHQAVEAREGIKIERENQTLATITFQNYFRMYEKLSGMTGTAFTEANEFKQIYNVDCIVLPTNRSLKRKNHPDCIYKTESEKFKAVVEEIAELHKEGRPVLVGTISIERSEYLSSLLKQRGVEHQVLNAKYHDLEAHIVAQAGRYKAVTIATNMAGRGTDIVLGGNAEHLAKSFAENIIKAEEAKESKEKKEEKKDRNEFYKQYLDKFKAQVAVEHEKVVALGGLHVLGTERHESRRIDNQLRGRSGRQGDPGSSRFYVALEDDLMRLFGSDRMMGLMNTLGMEEGQVIEHPSVSWAIETAQKRVETYNFEIRKQLLEYDNVMNRQREVIYAMRRSILEGENIKERIIEALDETVRGIVVQYLFSGQQDQEWDIEGFKVCLKTTFNLDISASAENLTRMTQDQIEDMLYEDLLKLYEEKEKAIGIEQMRGLERMILLQTIDFKWKDHLYAMDQLKEGIGLRAFGHRDPLVEYQREAFSMFELMYHSVMQEAVETAFKVEPLRDQQRVRSVFANLPQQFVHAEHSSLTGNQPVNDGQGPQINDEAMGVGRGRAPAVPQPERRASEKVGRNDPCPCGSGKKYKKCCGQ